MTFLFVSAVAEPITNNGATGDGHHRIRMGDGSVQLTITPDVARQWIGELEPIAKESNV